MKPVLRVIIIEDSPDDALLMLRELEHAGYAAQAQRVQTAEELRDALAHGTWDLVLADYSLPHFTAAEGLAMLWKTGLDVPFIVVSGSIGEEMAVQLMRDGAADYVMKDHLALLGPAVQRELHDADERKRKRDVEQALAESEKRYRLLIENQTDLIVKTDPEGRFLYASPAYCALFGKSLPELMGSSYQPLVHPDDLPSVEHAVADLSHPPHACRYEERAMTVDGWKWIEWTARAELDSHGNVVALLGSGRDITDRKKAEEALRESELRYHTFIDVTSDLVFLKDEFFRYIVSNRANNAYLGRSETNVIGSTDVDLMPNDAATACRASDQKALAEGRDVASEETVGSRIYQTIKFPVPFSDGRIGVGGYVRDITERKKAEGSVQSLLKKLQEEKDRLSLVLGNMTDEVWFADTTGHFTLENPAACKAFALENPGAIDIQSFAETLEVLRPDGSPRPVDEAPPLRALAGETIVSQEEIIRLPLSGELRDRQVSASPVRDPEGHVIGCVSVVRDITDRKKAEAEKEALQAQLYQSQKLEAIGQLAGGVAHDFNNLLTGILGNVAIMRSDLPASDPLVANLAAVETAARQAADLAKGLLTFSRRAVVAAAPLDMGEAVDTSLGILKQSLPATMSIVRDVEPGIWSVLADRSQITQVLLNLAVNARDAMQGNGALIIRLRNEEVGEAYVLDHSFARMGEFVRLSVADTGPGMPDEIREHLFEPFRTTKPAGSGTGLGLSIVYGAVKQAGGWVTADSPASGGAVFDIFLPRCEGKPSAQTTPADIAVNTCSGTVLVVEDEEMVRAVAQALLKRSGCTALTAGDGASALRTLQEHQGRVDLILLDMTMPGMTTQEIIPALRALSPAVPILLTSGYTSNEEVRRMLDDGTVQGFLGKPYQVRELVDEISRLMKRS